MDLAGFNKYYSVKALVDKLKSLGNKGKEKLLYMVFLLMNIMKSKEVPIKSKALIAAALGYFILPADLIPDFIVGMGFTDDLSVLMMVAELLSHQITDDIRERSKTQAGKKDTDYATSTV